MRDPFNRSICYLRLSLTKACSMRCVYCRPSHIGEAADSRLTCDEIVAIAEHLVTRHGLRKIRLTGGEPTVRPDLTEIVDRLASISGLRELTMTTNGLTLKRHALPFANAGLKRINVSLDSLDRDNFQRITGVDGLDKVIDGIDAAIAAGLSPVKLNTVVQRNLNDHELPALVKFAAERGCEIRFIELMPMGPLASQWRERYVSAQRMREILKPTVDHWQPLPQGSGSATRYGVAVGGKQTTLGFITPVSCNFCSQCDRLRLTSDGGIYPCLMDEPRGSFLSAVRPTFDPAHFDRALREALRGKNAEHPAQGVAVMTTIGG